MKHSMAAGWMAGAMLALAAALLPAPRAWAQVSDCAQAREPVPGAAGELVFKLMLDKLVGTTDAGDPEIVHRALLSKLQDNFDKARLELGRFRIVLCLDRSPAQIGDILADADGFADNGVVLETWGFFDGAEATLSHAFVPLLATKASEWRPAVDHVSITYRYDGGDKLSFLKSMVSASPEVRIFAAFGAASAAYSAQDLDKARRYFCRTLLMLRTYQDEPAMRIDPLDRQELETFLDDMSLRIIDDAVQARAAGTYSGTLGSPVTPPGTRCGEGGP